MERNYSIHFSEVVRQGFGLTKTITFVVGFPNLLSLVDSFSLGGISTHDLRKKDYAGTSERSTIGFSKEEINFILRFVKSRTPEHPHAKDITRGKGLYKLWKRKNYERLIAAYKATKLLGVKIERPNWKQIWQKEIYG